ncbi:MAG: hypothetical protein V2A34_13045, partial [Lentisphaerota bacterium]
LSAAATAGLRGPSVPETAPTPAQKRREALDVLHKVNQYLVVPCSCGIQFKIPPDFNRTTFDCPRCGAAHQVPVAPMAAAAAVLQGIPGSQKGA